MFENFPTASAVILRHEESGAKPISGEGMGLSSAASHDLDYNGRRGEYEEKGGCDREATDQDRDYEHAATIGSELQRDLDYNARLGAYSEKGADRQYDATYFGQDGVLTREQIESDMLACGGSFLQSIVTVDRQWASQLGLDTKDAFEGLLRRNWPEMMASCADIADPKEVRWYACYHTDAPESLHVHVTTWIASGALRDGWHPSAAETRTMKAELYRDAYRPVMLQRDILQDYLRDYLTHMVRVEMGHPMEMRDEYRLERKAAAAGVEPLSVERSIAYSQHAEVDRKLDVVRERIGEKGGFKARDYPLHAAANDTFKRMREESVPLNRAWEMYRDTIERKADMAGLSVSDRDVDTGKDRGNEIDVIKHERDRFIRSEMTDIRHRVENAIIREVDPQTRIREAERTIAFNLVRNVSRDCLDLVRNPLKLDEATVKELKRDIAEYNQAMKNADPSQILRERPLAERMWNAVSNSDVYKQVLEREAANLKEVNPLFRERDIAEIKNELDRTISSTFARRVEFELREGRVQPYRDEGRQIERNAVNELTHLIHNVERTLGSSIGLEREEGRIVANQLSEIRNEVTRIREQMPKDSFQRVRESDLSPEGRNRLENVARIIVGSPTVQGVIERTHANASMRFGGETPEREMIQKGMTSLIKREIVTQANREVERDREMDKVREVGGDMALTIIAARVAAALAQSTRKRTVPHKPKPREHKRDES